MKISLNHGLEATIDAEDYPLVAGYHWHAQRHRHTWYALANVQRNDGSVNNQGRSRRTTIKMHRLILKAKPKQLIDHDDGNGLNNSRRNIAISTPSKNQQNQHAIRAKSGFMGVYQAQSGKLQAQIKRDGKKICLGSFVTAEEAAEVRRRASCLIRSDGL
jgi:hypothetical protein